MKKKTRKRTAANRKKLQQLHLDKPTSHGGWPHGHPGSFVDNKRPVNVQIADYLEDMGMLEDVPHGRLSEAIVREIIKILLKESNN